jgi:hypothetical protein
MGLPDARFRLYPELVSPAEGNNAAEMERLVEQVEARLETQA